MAGPSDSMIANILPTSCLECGRPVAQITRMKREYCSDDCKAARKRRLRRMKTPPMCNICGEAFKRSSNRQKVCAGCRSAKSAAYTKAYNDANSKVVKERRRVAMRRLKAADPEAAREKQRKWRLRNRDAIAARRKTENARRRASENFRRRYASDPAFAVHVRMASAVHQAIREQKAGRKWEAVVGYSLNDLMKHLERQFLPGMSWDNMGRWHIDHITPKAAFDYQSDDDPEFRACWALSNLRPLWSGDNQKKHAKRLFLV